MNLSFVLSGGRNGQLSGKNVHTTHCEIWVILGQVGADTT